VNSAHHQGICALGKGLFPAARSDDGLIEAICMPEKKFVYAVQWHPDAMGKKGYGVFREFRKVCIRYKTVNDYKRTPHKPAIKNITVDGNSVKIRWDSARNAKKYRLLVQKGDDGWKFRRKVPYRGEYRELYSDSLKYKLVHRGNYYRVYVKKNPYREVKTLRGTEYTFRGKSGEKYTFVVQAINGAVHSDYSAAKMVTGTVSED